MDLIEETSYKLLSSACRTVTVDSGIPKSDKITTAYKIYFIIYFY